MTMTMSTRHVVAQKRNYRRKNRWRKLQLTT